MTAPPTIETAIQLKVLRLVGDGNAALRDFALHDVVGVVMTLHTPSPGQLGPWCTHCGGDYGGSAPWPCDTVKVIAAAIGLKEGDWR